MIKRPFFIVGSERSGTTLFRLMLDHHPRIACHFEFEHSVDGVSDDGRFPEVGPYAARVDHTRFHQFPDPIVDASLSYPELVDSFLVQKQEHSGGKPIVGGTVHQGFERLLHIWPDARFIHIFRDGRDVARSCISMGWDGNAYTAIDRWIAAEQSWDRLAARLDPRVHFEVRYEELIAEAERVLSEVCCFLEDEYDPKMMSYASRSTYALPNPSLATQWRKGAPRREIEMVESKAAELLEKRGYELSEFPRVEYSLAEQRELIRESAWKRRRWRWRKIGPVLMVLDNLTRWVPIPPAKAYVDRRLEEIRVASLK